MRPATIASVVASAIICLALATVASAAPTYTLTPVGDPSTPYPRDLNNYGQILLSAGGGKREQGVWTPHQRNGSVGTITLLPRLRDEDTYHRASRINDLGQIVGASGKDGYGGSWSRGVIWQPTRVNGTEFSVHDLGLASSFEDTSAREVNNRGQILGLVYGRTSTRSVLFHLDGPNATTGKRIELGEPVPEEHIIYPYINERGQVAAVSVGDRGVGSTGLVVWTPWPWMADRSLGNWTVVGQPPVGPFEPHGINDLGQVTGVGLAPNAKGFLWTPSTPNGDSGSYQMIGDGANLYDLSAPNNSAEVVGWTYDGKDHPFYWNPRDGLHELDDLLAPDMRGWTVIAVADINDLGQIAARATYDPDGSGPVVPQSYTVLLTPVPESAITVAAAAATMLLVRRRSTVTPITSHPHN